MGRGCWRHSMGAPPPVGSSGGQAVGSVGRLSWRWPVCRSAGGKDTSPHWGITEPGLRAWRLVSAHVSVSMRQACLDGRLPAFAAWMPRELALDCPEDSGKLGLKLALRC